MNPIIVIKTTINTLVKNKLRSFITLLSIVMGIAIIVAMYNIGLGVKDRVTDMFSNFGYNIILIKKYSYSKGYFQTSKDINIKDVNLLREKCPEIYTMIPILRDTLPVKYRNNTRNITFMGTNVNYFYVDYKKLESGNFFGISDEIAKTSVCVIGNKIARKLFGSQDAAGNTVFVGNAPFRVIGVLDHIERGSSVIDFSDPDDTMYVPYTTAMSKSSSSYMRRGNLYNLLIFAYPHTNVTELIEKIRKTLNEKYHITEASKETFNIESLDQFLELRSKMTDQYRLLLSSIAMIALLVSGINIMNIMLVSVRQRTKEIGIRLALGARKKDIIAQFLTEAVVLCLFGGVIGAVLSFPLSLFGAKLLNDPVKFSYGIISITFFYSVFLGVVFGVYPASRAASVEPMEALRYE